jgi:RNA polymerase sigma-70 factor (ECF subfamily)
MRSTEHHANSTAPGTGNFALTRWSVVLAAGSSDSTHARDALETLCRTYWHPIYAYVRRQGHSPHDAQDLTQEFFARLLQKNYLGGVDRAKGRFRSFLLVCLKHFLANEWDKAGAQKRGAHPVLIPINVQSAETAYGLEPAESQTADKIFERRWALTLLDQVLARLRAEYTRDGKAKAFNELKSTLTGERRSVPYAEVGVRLAMSEGAVKVAVHRLRQRYRELLREEIAHTVSGPEQVEEEIRALFSALSD